MPSRIADLPERDWTELAAAACEVLTAELRTPHGTQTLRPEQGAALYEVSQCGGFAGGLTVGCGKTLIAGLAPRILKATRPLIVTLGGLVQQTRSHLERLSIHWQIPVDQIEIQGYEWLSQKGQADFFGRDPPYDLVIFDEAHKLKRVNKSSVPRRFARCVATRPGVRVVVLSGSFDEDGLTDYAHAFDWALRAGVPFPRTPGLQKMWGQALDETRPVKLKPKLELFAADLGPVRSYPELVDRYQRRLTSTPGIIISNTAYNGSRLQIEPLTLDLSPDLQEHFRALREHGIAPDDWDLMNAGMGGELWQTARMLGVGYYNRHDPWPPDPWYSARRAYGKFERKFLETSTEIDTPAQLQTLLRKGKLIAEPWTTWSKIAPSFDICRKPEWISAEVVNFVENWVRKMRLPNLCIWSAHPEFSRVLAARLSIPWHDANGLDAEGRHIEQASGTVISSIKANSTGNNLQHNFNNALVVGWPTTSGASEQMIGRHYREGQSADLVRFWSLFTCLEHSNALKKAFRRAQAIEGRSGQPQVLTRAEITWPELGVGPAWETNNIGDE